MATGPQPPPYRPGYGSAPEPLLGRDGLLERINEAIRSSQWGVMGEGIRLVGPRGIGKTSLLREVERRVTDTDRLKLIIGDDAVKPWVVLRGEADGELLEGWTAQIARHGRSLDPKRDWRVELGASLPGGLASAKAHRAPTATTVQFGLMEIAALARSKGRPIMAIIDELHEVEPGELKAVTASANQLNGTGHPLIILTAEIPGRADLSHVTYFRDRAIELAVGHLTDRAAASALIAPAKARGVDWTPTAVDQVVRAANGYPFALQTHAAEAWKCAPPGGPIDTGALTSTRHGWVQLGVPGWNTWIRSLQNREPILTDEQSRRAKNVASASVRRPVNPGQVLALVTGTTGQASFSTNFSSWRRLRHSYAPSQWAA